MLGAKLTAIMNGIYLNGKVLDHSVELSDKPNFNPLKLSPHYFYKDLCNKMKYE